MLPLLIFNSILPFIAGFGIGILFNLGSAVALLLGIIFTSSSIAVIIPSLEQNGLLRTHLGKTLVVNTVLVDALSIALLSVLLQTINPSTVLPLPALYALLFVALVVLSIILPKIRRRLSYAQPKHEDLFEHELRLVFVILLGVVAFFHLFGLHPIIAGFFAGMVLSGSIQSSQLKTKLHSISYGIFIPVFFIIVGTKTDPSLIIHDPRMLALTGALIVGSVGAKFFSGWIGARLSHFNTQESIFVGVASIPHLSTALAVSVAGVATGIINDAHATAIISLAIVTTLAGPLLINVLAKFVKENASKL
jgi:Kef-type K+ transport system membrane component KefB